MEKWDKIYQEQLETKSYIVDRETEISKVLYKEIYEEITRARKIDSSTVYLEIGCGPMVLGELIASEAKLVIGVDFSPSALKIVEQSYRERGLRNYLLILADIKSMPIKDNCVDLIYGGGVLEHFLDTEGAVKELRRVLKVGGVSFTTVPYLNLTALTYRQLTGHIPNFPILKQLAEFVHCKILKGNHMLYGYELSFLGSTMKKIHEKAGFKKVTIDRFKITVSPLFVKNIFLKRICAWLVCNSRLFWPLIKIVAEK